MSGNDVDADAEKKARSTMTDSRHVRLAVALEGAGWHPAAWQEPTARPLELFTAEYWVDLVEEAERGQLDFVTIEDSLGLQSSSYDGPDGRIDQVRGRLDAVLVAARVAPLTRQIGIVPTSTVTHTEPFHVSKAIATLDYVTSGRAGWHAQLSRPSEGALFGRTKIPVYRVGDEGPEFERTVAELFEEAGDFVEVVRRLWDSWEDDAEIRDAASGRFIDRNKLHYIDFHGRWFDVKGPSITPRPPQGQPLVVALAHATPAYRFAVRSADVIFVTPSNSDDASAIAAEVQNQRRLVDRTGESLHTFADLVVFLDDSENEARQRKSRLDALNGSEYRTDALVFAGTSEQLADLLQLWQQVGISGFRLRPGAIPHDLEAVTRLVVPELRRRGAFRRHYEANTLRGLLGLGRPVNRYATASG
jgi:alkanesulfonate monooxygenase SsuD/methylene tetrahydromethanopterin reductase-like flavin-dependent oxidoreductase (luciferase family)